MNVVYILIKIDVDDLDSSEALEFVTFRRCSIFWRQEWFVQVMVQNSNVE